MLSTQNGAVQRSKIAQELGESSSSPLLSRVIIGEDSESDTCCITVDAIHQALAKCRFFNEYGKKNIIKRQGTFDFENIDITSEKFFDYITSCLSYIRSKCLDQWNRGRQGVLTINRGIQACIRVIDDITTLLVDQNKIHPLKDDIDKMVAEVCFYIDPLCDYISSLSEDKETELKRTYGTNADLKFYRYFQKPISDAFSDYNPDGLEEYFENQSKKFNDTSRDYIYKIEKELRSRVEKALSSKFGSSWERDGIPKDILRRIHNDAFEKNLEEGTNIRDWDCTTLKDFTAIATYASNWSTIFESILTRPQDQGKGRKEEKLSWIDVCDAERTKLAKNPSYSVPRKTFELIKEVYEWFCS